MIRLSLRDHLAHLERRKAELGLTGYDYVPKNSGARRTERKKAILRALREDAEKEGREPTFKSEQ